MPVSVVHRNEAMPPPAGTPLPITTDPSAETSLAWLIALSPGRSPIVKIVACCETASPAHSTSATPRICFIIQLQSPSPNGRGDSWLDADDGPKFQTQAGGETPPPPPRLTPPAHAGGSLISHHDCRTPSAECRAATQIKPGQHQRPTCAQAHRNDRSRRNRSRAGPSCPPCSS